MNNTENPLTVSELQNLANLARLDLIEISEGMRESIHWGSAFSIMEIAGVLYSNVIDEKKDMVLLSKGQGGPGIYALMHRLGLISDETWKTFHCDGSSLSELMEYNKKLGFYISGGSLGLALSYACGVGLLWKKTKKDGRIYVIMGDGEVDEGSVWEAFMSIGHFKLDNITLIIDANGLQSDGEVDMIMPLPDLVKLVTKNVHHKHQNALPNGIIVLKGGSIEGEINPFRKWVEVTPITQFYPAEWYKEKYVIYLPL